MIALATTVAPAASADVVTESSSRAAALSCEHKGRMHLTLVCYRGGWKIGQGYWDGEWGTAGNEEIYINDKRSDGRYVSINVAWWQNGRMYYKKKTDPSENNYGWYYRFKVPEGAKVRVFMCMEDVGCSYKYRSFA